MTDKYESGSEHTGKYVAYYRVSTTRQGQSGLGLEAQQEIVKRFLNGGDWKMTAEFIEVESGTKNNRPELDRAIEKCKQTGATLIVAKLDRLSRNAGFLITMRDSRCDFVVADMPDANEMTIGMMALVAEYERKQTAERTRRALAALKARGEKLGAPEEALRRAGVIGNERKKAIAYAKAQETMEVIEQLKRVGLTSLRQLCQGLQDRGVKTPSGKPEWHPQQVRNIIKTAGEGK